MKILITGGNKGIGKACTRLFLEAGHKVVVIARDTSVLSPHDNLQCFDIDLLLYKDIRLDALGIADCDVLINNAGIMNGTEFEGYPSIQSEDLMAVNVEAPLYLIEQLLPHMKENGGRVVSVGSIAGHIGHKDIWYGISKAAVHNFTKSLAKQFGKHNIQFTCVAPGPVYTDMLATVPEERKKELQAAAITGRFAQPEEVAETIFWLATKAPQYINGICIDIKDGTHFRA